MSYFKLLKTRANEWLAYGGDNTMLIDDLKQHKIKIY